MGVTSAAIPLRTPIRPQIILFRIWDESAFQSPIPGRKRHRVGWLLVFTRWQPQRKTSSNNKQKWGFFFNKQKLGRGQMGNHHNKIGEKAKDVNETCLKHNSH